LDEEALWGLINDGRERMNVTQRRLWDVISIDPEPWVCASSTGKHHTVWVVALIGRSVISYNDAEAGFDRSTFLRYGEVLKLGWGQDDLEVSVQHVLNELESGHRSAAVVSEPNPGSYPRRDT